VRTQNILFGNLLPDKKQWTRLHALGFIGILSASGLLFPSWGLAQTPSCSEPSEGMVACYPFDGDAKDYSGNGYHGTISGTITPTADRLGNANSAYKFSKFKDIIKLPNGSLNGYSETTVSIWLSVDNLRSMGILSGAKNNIYHNEYLIFLNNGKVAPSIYTTSYPTGWAVPVQQFFHLAITTSSKAHNTYVNGQLVKAVQFTKLMPPLQISSFLHLGQDQDCVNGCFETGQQFYGVMDDLRIYKRALSPSEIEQLAGIQPPKCEGITTGLVACYPFDGNSLDGSGNSNHALAHSGVSYVTGTMGQAAKLNGGYLGYLRVPNPIQKFTDQYTIAAWVSTNGRGQSIFSKYSYNPGVIGFHLWSTSNDGNGSGFSGSTLFAISGFNNEGWMPGKYPSYTLPIKEFHHVSAIYNAGNTKLYIDGVLVSEKTVQHTGTLDNPYDILIGTYYRTYGRVITSLLPPGRTFDGLLDDLRIYNRALSEIEIKQLYGKMTLTVTKTGYGDVTATGINCGTDCTEGYSADTQITLTAIPMESSQFVNWGGDCTGTATTTTVTLSEAKNCSANFVTVRNSQTDPCVAGVATVKSVKTGNWSDPTTWSPAVVPNSSAWVTISAGTTVTLKEPPLIYSNQPYRVRGLCVARNAILTSAANSWGQPTTWVAIQAASIRNRGTIKGANGLNGIDPDGRGPRPFRHATGGSNIILWGNQVVNDGTIIAGNGGTDSTWLYMADNYQVPALGGAGGSVEIYPARITNNGIIRAGNGGVADRCGMFHCVHGNGTTKGGNGGLVRVQATNMAESVNSSTGKLIGGWGGSAEVWWNGTGGRAGVGGRAEVNIGNNRGTIIGGGPGGVIGIDPTTLTFDSTTRIEDADDIVIFGGEDWIMELRNLSEGAINAAKTITLAIGKEGVIDFRGSAANALKAAEKVEIFANSILLDEGVTLQQVVQTPNLITGPAKILYYASWSGTEHVVAEPGETVTMSMTLINGGPTEDSYTLTMTNVASEFNLKEVPTVVTIAGQAHAELNFEVTVPATRGAEDVITWVATSQNDPSMTAVAEIRINVKPDETVEPTTPNTEITGASAFGKLVDDFNQPVAGVIVQLGEEITTTDAEGNWRLTGLPVGESAYVATLSGSGYQSQVIQCQQNKNSLYTCHAKPVGSLLQLKVGVSPSSAVGLEENLTYNVTVTNTGTETAIALILEDILPTGAELLSLESLDGGDCDMQTVSCTLPDLAANASSTVKLVIKPMEVTVLENTVKVTAHNYPGDIAKTLTEVKPLLSVKTKDTPDPVNMLDKLQYTYQVELSPLATAAATEVKLVSELPSGVELQTATTEFGDCDTTTLPIVICSLPDLPVGGQTTVNLEVLLKDAGMLLLTNDATVFAANYSPHTVKERTPIFIPDDVKMDMIFVLDTTNSMQEELNGVVAAIKTFIAEVPADQRPSAALVTFKDDVKLNVFTQDLQLLLNAAEQLRATGGGECPEASAEALEIGLKHLQDGGILMLATDASPYPETDLSQLEDQIKQKNVKFHALISGDCAMADSQNNVKEENSEITADDMIDNK